ALAMLEALPDGDRLCHGDFHPANVLVGRNGPAVIDWTGATRGDPAADLARTRLLLQAGAVPEHMPFLIRRLHALGRGPFYAPCGPRPADPSPAAPAAPASAPAPPPPPSSTAGGPCAPPPASSRGSRRNVPRSSASSSGTRERPGRATSLRAKPPTR